MNEEEKRRRPVKESTTLPVLIRRLKRGLYGFFESLLPFSGLLIVIVIILSISSSFWSNRWQEAVSNLDNSRQLVTVVVAELEETKIEITKLRDVIVKETDSTHVRSLLSDWVYEHSSKISKAMADEIVNAVIMKSNYPLVLLALMRTESSFNPTAISSKGAMGLGQIMPKFFAKPLKEVGIIKDMRDVFNIPTGVEATEFAWTSMLVRHKGNVVKALHSYLGATSERYVEQILQDFFYLTYLTRNVGGEKE